jgi:hypothetical protein
MKRSNLWLLWIAIILLASVLCAYPLTKTNEILVLTNVTVIDGNGGRPAPNMTVVISGERITDMFATGKKPLPEGATVMNLSGIVQRARKIWVILAL